MLWVLIIAIAQGCKIADLRTTEITTASPDCEAKALFSNRKTAENGITYPGTMTIQLNKLKKEKRFIHRIATDKLELNSFQVRDLYPIEGLRYLGDQKKQ